VTELRELDELPVMAEPDSGAVVDVDADSEAEAAPEARSRRLRPNELKRKRELQEQIEDLEDWITRINETLEELRDEAADMRVADLEAELLVAQEELGILHEEWQDLVGGPPIAG